MILRSGKCPWRTRRRRPSSVSLSAWQLRKAATSAPTACASSARAPLRSTSVSGSAKVAFLAEALANHPNRSEMVQHVLDQLRTIVDQIAEGQPGGSHQGSA